MFRSRVSHAFYGLAVSAILLACSVAPATASPANPQARQSQQSNSIGFQTYKYKAGFDACTSAINNQNLLLTWYLDSPFFVIGMYLGGVTAVKEGCGPLSQANLNYAISLGWAIEPLWYGPQVPQSCGRSVASTYISLDPSVAYTQGVNEADAASAKAQSLGFGPDNVITYDMEAYGKSSSTCVAAANAFINGWDYELFYHPPYMDAVYGGTQSVYFPNLAKIGNVPNYIWPYSPAQYTTVYGLLDLPDGEWNLNQRYHQSTSIGPVTYGGVSASIDEDCADTVVDTNNTGTPTNPVNNCNRY